eukprot:PhM_4_TR15728/c0_g1_i1/m.88208/K20298/VPS52; vacuolar protein sorting-associated protein 52
MIDLQGFDLTSTELDVDDLEACIERFKVDPRIHAILEKETNLRVFIDQNEDALSVAQEEQIQRTVASAEGLAHLHKEIATCESILGEFEEEIRGFRASLSDTAREMRTLRGRTMTVAQQSNNRRELAVRLADIQEKLHVPESLLTTLATGDINASYMDNLRQLEQHIRYIKEYGLLESCQAREEVWPQIEQAVTTVSSRLQVHISRRLQQLQVENTNIGIVQQTIASSCAFANYFVGQYAADSYRAICGDYKDTMGRVYLSHTKAHLKELQKYQSSNTTRGLKKPEMSYIVPKDFFDVKKGKENSEKKFSLEKFTSAAATRIRTLGKEGFDLELKDRLFSLVGVDGVEGQLFVDPSVLEQGRAYHTWCDTLVQCFIRVANRMMTERLFEKDFFQATSVENSTWRDILEGVFTRSFLLLGDTLRKELDDHPMDICGAVIVARGLDIVRTYFTHSSDDDPPPALLSQLNDWSEVLKSRVMHLFSVNLRTVKDLNLVPLQPHRFHFKHSVVEAIASDAALAQTLQMHPVVRRYAEFSGEMHFLNTMPVRYSRVPAPDPTGKQTPTSPSGASPLMMRDPNKRTVFEDYIQTALSTTLIEMRRLITSLSKRHANATLQTIFLINNYNGVLDTWSHGGCPMDVPDYVEVQKVLYDLVNAFVDQEFSSCAFGRFFDFVVKYEPLVTPIPSGLEDDGGLDDAQQQALSQQADPATTTDQTATSATYHANQEIVNAHEMQTLVLHLHKSWQATLGQLHESVGKYFGAESGVTTVVLRSFFLKTLELNQRLRKLVFNCFSNPPFRSKLLSNQTLVHEMSRYVSVE